MPPHEVDSHPAAVATAEAELVARLERALAELPEAERTAVMAAVGYAGGSVGAAMELGLDPETLSDVERRRQHTDLVTQLHEEASELGRAVGGYKRHVLRAPAVERYAVAIECVDVVKCALATAQLHGVDARMFASLFRAKTREISAKHAAERHTFGEILATDLDDVVADLEPWRQELGITTLSERGGPAERLRASESMKEQFYAGGRFRELAPIPGAPEALRRAKAAGFSIVIITARPQWQYKRLQSDTHDWLRAHDIPCDLLLFSRNKVEAVYEHLTPAWPVVFVEDHPGNARALAEVGINVLLFNRPHNENEEIGPGIARVAGWDEILKRLGI